MDRRRSSRCAATGKTRFRDHEAAVEALHGAARSRHWAAALGGSTRRREVRAYRCDSCRGWHLTSTTTWSAQPREVAELLAEAV